MSTFRSAGFATLALVSCLALLTCLLSNGCGMHEDAALDPVGGSSTAVRIDKVEMRQHNIFTDAILPTRNSSYYFSVVLSQGSAVRYSWDLAPWGDPTSSTEKKPLVRLQAAGSYVASVTVWDSAGNQDTKQFGMEIEADGAIAPPTITDFSVSPASVTAGDLVGCNATVEGYDSLEWQAQDLSGNAVGSFTSPASQSTFWSCSTAGDYRIRLVADYSGSSTITDWTPVSVAAAGGGGGTGSGSAGENPGSGGGDPAFVLIWDWSGSADAEGPDIDLWVRDPRGNLMSNSGDGNYYAHQATPDGGMIDLDDRGQTEELPGDGGGPERCSWPPSTAPQGEYSYGVRYYAGTGTAHYTVFVFVGDSTVATRSGNLSSPGERVELGALTAGTVSGGGDPTIVADLLVSGPDGAFHDTYSGTAPLTVNLDASSSSGGNPLYYLFDLDGDGNEETDNGTDPVWEGLTFNAEGTYSVGLLVADDQGYFGRATATIIVGGAANSPPVASFTADPNPVEAGSIISFDAGASYDPDGDALTYGWDFDGDGSDDYGAGIPNAAHSYSEPGSYHVILTLHDGHFAVSTDTTVDVIAAPVNQPPVALLYTETLEQTANTYYGWDASGSYDPEGGTLSLQFIAQPDWVDPPAYDSPSWQGIAEGGHWSMSLNVGTFNVYLKATDTAGNWDITSLTVNAS